MLLIKQKVNMPPLADAAAFATALGGKIWKKEGGYGIAGSLLPSLGTAAVFF